MQRATQKFIDELKKEHCPYKYLPESELVGVSIRGESAIPSTAFIVAFNDISCGKDTVSCSITCPHFFPFPKSKLSKMLELVNMANMEFYEDGLAKFYVNVEENCVSMEMHGFWPISNVGSICFNVLMACFDMCAEVYPELQRAV